MRLRPRLPELLNVVAVAVFVEIGLRTLRLPRLARILGVQLDLESEEPPRGADPIVPVRAARSAAKVDAVMKRWPVEGTCLRHSLVLGHRLRWLGPVLRIGVRREGDGSLMAHAWLELDGQSMDPSMTEYAILGGAVAKGGLR